MHCEYIADVNQISMGNKLKSWMLQFLSFDIITFYDVMITYKRINWKISLKGLTCEKFIGMSIFVASIIIKKLLQNSKIVYSLT